MIIRTNMYITTFALMSVIAALIAFGMVYPFLPGGYDGLAVGLSMMAQVFGIVGLPLIPLGAL
jgi:hypothetical protein